MCFAEQKSDNLSKLLVVSAEEAKDLILKREREELEALWEREHMEPEAVFIAQALAGNSFCALIKNLWRLGFGR